MKTRMKKVLSLFIAFSMVFSIFCTSIFDKNRAYAEEGNVQNQENQDCVYTVNDAISVCTSYFNEEYYKRNRKVLNGWEYLAMKKAEGELSKDDWKINSRIAKQGEYDSLKTLGGKAKQSFVLLELGEDPTKYEGRNLIQELADELNKTTSIRFVINEMQAMIAIDRYNSIYSDNKVDYNAADLIKLILKEQGEDGAVSKSPNNTAYAVELFSKHGDIQGVNEAKEKAINYLKNKMTPDGGIYLTRHFTHLHAETIAELLKSGEFKNTEEWSKDGKSVIDGLFIYWNGKFLTDKDGKKEHPTGLAYPYTLYALALLRDAGFGDYKLNGVKFDNLVKEEPEQVCKSNIVVVYPTDDGKLDIKLKPSQVEVSNKKQLAGLTVLGALEAATKEYEAKGSMVKSICGIANEGSNGWMYTLNGKMVDTYANETVIKDGDKIVWYYSKSGMEAKVPTYDEIVEIVNNPVVEKPEEQENKATVNDSIRVLINHFNSIYYKKNSRKLTDWAYVALKKAEGELTKKDWNVSSAIPKTGNYDSLTTVGGKAKQSIILLELGEDPSNYKNRNLIQELAEELNKTTDSRFIVNEMQAMIAIDRFNSLYTDKKVEYNAADLIKLIIKKQKENGCVDSAPHNTAYALEVFSKHSEIEGVSEAKEKAINYLKNTIKPDGGIYEKYYATNVQAETVRELVKAGEFTNILECSKDGKSAIDGLFKYWNGEFLTDSRNNKKEDTNPVYPETLYTLTILRDAGFGDYQFNGVKFNNIGKEEPDKEEPEQVCKSNIVVVYPTDDGKLDIKLKPSQVEVSNKKQLAGLTVLGALEAATKEYEAKGSMVKSICGIANEGSNGWMYTLNGKMVDTYANETVIKDGDKIVWYYSKNGMEGHIPTWEELTDQKVAVTGVTLDKETIVLKEGETLKLNAAIIPQNATNKNLTWTSGDTKVAVVNENGSVTGIKVGTTVITVTALEGQKTAKCNVEVKAKESIEPKDYTKEVNASIESVSNIILKGTIGDWQAASLAALGKTVPESYLNTITEKIKNRDKDLFKNGKFEEASACARTIIGIVAAGKDPRDIGNYNLVEDLCSRDMLKLSDIYAITYSLIALDSGNFKLPKNCSFTREDLVNKIINMENKSGGWGFGASADVDTTAMVLGALSNYTNNVSVKESVDKAVKVLSSLQNSNGGYTSTWDNKDTSESTSQTILALCALGIDPSSEMFTKGEKNLMDALFSFRTLDGGLAHNNEDLKTYNEFATEQAFRALAAYRRFKDGKIGSIYLFKEFKDDTKNEKEIDIRNLTFQREFKLDSEAKVTIQAISNCKDNKNVTLIVALFDENDKMINYVAVKHLIKPQEISELEGMIKLPKEGKYKVRAFVWDDFDKLNVLSDEIIIPVVE